MKVSNNFIQGRMEKDLDLRLIPKGMYRDLLNGRVVGSDEGKVGIIENIPGTLELTNVPELPEGYNVIGIKSWNNLIYYIATNNTNTLIGEYNKETDSHRYIIQNTLFNLDKDIPIVNIEIFETNGDRLMIFMDKNNSQPYKINVERAFAGAYTNDIDIDLIKAPPSEELSIAYSYDSTLNQNFLKDESFQFAYQYVYEDGEVSAISFYSRVDFDNREETIDDGKYVVGSFVGDDNTFRVRYSFDHYQTPNGASQNILVPDNVYDIDIGDALPPSAGRFVAAIAADNKAVIANSSWTIPIASFDLPQGTRYESCAVSNNANVILFGIFGPNDDFFIYKYVPVSGGSDKIIYVHTIAGGEPNINPRRRLCTSNTGKVCYCSFSNQIHKSTDFGNSESWERVVQTDEINGIDDADYYMQSICCSEDGNIVYATANKSNNGNGESTIIKSTDAGKTWGIILQKASTTEPTNINYSDIKCSSDGKHICVGTRSFDSGTIPLVYVSNNGGSSFNSIQIVASAPNLGNASNTNYVAVSSSGKYMYVVFDEDDAANDRSVRVSRDYGQTFTLGEFQTTSKNFAITTTDHETLNKGLNNIDNNYNKVTLSYNSGSEFVRKVRLLLVSPNTNQVYLIKEIDKASENILNDQIEDYIFLNDGTYQVIPTLEASKLYDNIPQKARAFTLTQNSLVFGGYTDGYSLTYQGLPIVIDATVEPVKSALSTSILTTDIGLRTGSKNTYGIVYYDRFNRSSSVLEIGDLIIPFASDDPANLKYSSKITITHRPPEWAVKYKIVKKDIIFDYDIIDGFDNAYRIGDELYLEITSYVNITPNEGDVLELFSEINRSTSITPYVPPTSSLNVAIKRYVDNTQDVSDITLELSDGTNVVRQEQTTKTAEPVPPGRYIVIKAPSLSDYTGTDVDNNNDLYDTSVFYIERKRDINSIKVFREIPGTYDIIDGLHQGNTQNQTALLPAIVEPGDNDFDIVWGQYPLREMYLLDQTKRVINLGRPNAVSENFRQIDRYAGLIATDQYVEDTNFNGLASINLGKIPYKDLVKGDGEIEFLNSEDTNVEVYQKDRISRVLYKKDQLALAQGQAVVGKSDTIWGEQQRSTQIYGMSNFESFAEWNNQRYFVDTKRGVVLRKSMDGMTEISGYGMTDYFHDLLTRYPNVAYRGWFEPKFKNYVIFIDATGNDKDAVTFSEKVNGWESRLSIDPDKVVNDGADVYGFKDRKFYKFYSDILNYNTFFGTSYLTNVKFIENDNVDRVKTFTAIRVDGDKPDTVGFVANILTSIDDTFFETREGYHYAYIPMGFEEEDHLTTILGAVNSDVISQDVIPLKSFNRYACRIGNPVYVVGQVLPIGNIIDIGISEVTISTPTSVNEDEIIYTIENSVVDGDNLKGELLVVEVGYDTTDPIELSSVEVEADESKQ